MNKIVVIIALMAPTFIYGQYVETLSSDRPGQSISPNTVGKKAVQFQFGYTFSDIDESYEWEGTPVRGYSNFNTNEEIGNNLNLKTRFGIFEKTEVALDLTAGYTNSKMSSWSENADDYSESEQSDNNYIIGAAVRQNFINNTEAGFNLGAELQFFGDRFYGFTEYNLFLIVAASKQLSDKFSITGNAGSNLTEVDFFFTCNLGYSVTDKLGMYAEYYPIFSNTGKLTNDSNLRMAESYINTGLAYVISPNFMVDLSGGFLVSDYDRSDNADISEYNIQIGFTSRLDWR